MVNPFKHTAKVVAQSYRDASAADEGAGIALTGTILLTPFIALGGFLQAFTRKPE